MTSEASPSAVSGDLHVTQKLIEWNLEEYVQSFKDLGITKRGFRYLSKDDIEKIITNFEDRVIFNHKFKEYQESFSDLWQNLEIVRVETDNNDTLTSGSLTETITFGTVEVNNSNQHCEPSTSQSLREVLQSTAYGTNVLSLQRRLRDRERKRISDIIINHYLRGNPSREISNNQYSEWAADLGILFPKDNKVLFYKPMFKSNGTTIQRSGSLINALYNFNREYKIMMDNGNDSNEESEHEIDVPDDVVQVINWLQENLQINHTALGKWEAIRQYRTEFLHRTAVGDQSILSQYLSKFAILRQPEGHILIHQDFEKLYPSKTGNLNLKLPVFITQAYECLKTLKPRPKELKSPLSEIEIFLKSEGCQLIDKTALVLSLLSYLVPTTSVQKKRAKGNDEIPGWRPTKKEVQNGFITIIDDVSKLQETVDRRDRRFLAIKQTRQPFVILVGVDTDHINHAYVSINDFLYKFSSLVEALDTCFKAHFALNAFYSVESKALSMLLQTAVYDIFTEADKKKATASVLSLLNRFDITLE